MKNEPIIGVENVQKSSQWYQNVLGCKSIHGGDEFDVLTSLEDEVILCLHKWGAHEHPTLKNPTASLGNGLILYFRMEDLEEIRKNVERHNYSVEDEIRQNPNSGKKEFTIRDPDGYYLMISEYHEYTG